jgi:integrase
MARTLNRLRAKQVESLGPGRHADGGGLYLDRDEHGRSRWLFMWKRDGKRREMGLGAAGSYGVPLGKVRLAAEAARVVVKAGGDPIEVRDTVPEAPRVVPTFGEVADEFVASLSPQWRNEKHRAQWGMTLKTYAAKLRPTPVNLIDTAAVLEVLQTVWLEKPETASRLRGRIERVLDAARAKGLRAGENPARWRGHLDHLLPKRQKLTRGHHAALPYAEVPGFVGALRERDAVAAYALEFLILTAARSGEVLGARWGEVDLDAKTWTVPAERMKAGREHRVPLSPRAVKVLEAIKPLADTGAKGGLAAAHIFPGQGRGNALSGMSLAMLLRRMKVTTTVHGFRSSFRDWAGEASSFQREVAEAALAHTVGDATERAYRRGDALEKRRKLMNAWAGYVEPAAKGSNLLPFGRTAPGTRPR